MHTLGDYCYISYGLRPNSDEKTAKGKFKKEDLISGTKDKIHCREYIEAKDIGRYCIKRVRYLEYGTKRSPWQLVRPTFPELYEHPKLMFNTLGALTGIYNEDNLIHNHSLTSCVLWKDLRGVENKSIISSIKKYSHLSREEMETLSQGVDLLYLLAVMNSSYAMILLNEIRGKAMNIYPEYIRALPIPPASPAEQAALADKARRLMALHGAARADDVTRRQIEVLEAQVDKEARALYGAE